MGCCFLPCTLRSFGGGFIQNNQHVWCPAHFFQRPTTTARQPNQEGKTTAASPKTGLFRPVFLSGEWLNFLGAKMERVATGALFSPVSFLLRRKFSHSRQSKKPAAQTGWHQPESYSSQQGSTSVRGWVGYLIFTPYFSGVGG